MRIRLETPNKAPFWLVGDPARNERTEQSSGLTQTWRVTRQNNAQQGAEWPAQTFYDRGNQRVDFTAETRWEFPDALARMDCLAKLVPVAVADQLHAWAGDIWVRLDRAGGGWKEWKLPGAVVSLAATVADGEVALKLTYNVSAPGFANVTRSGGINLDTLFGYTGVVPAVSGVAASTLDTVYDSYGLAGWAGSRLRITLAMNTPDDVVTMDWPLWATESPTGFEPPFADAIATMIADWTAEFGSGAELQPGSEADPALLITSGCTGPQAFAKIEVWRGQFDDEEETVIQSWEDYGDYTGYTGELTDNDGEPILFDLG